jgi:glyoxylase-like metal-dependent hydrolase (beta-lactamase superfamily II)
MDASPRPNADADRLRDATEPPVAVSWFQTRRDEDAAITRIWEPHVHRLLRANFWHVRGAERDLVIDGGLGVGCARQALPWMFAREPLLVLTHAHCDHTGAAPEFDERWIHEAEADALREPEPWSLHLPSLGEDLQAGALALAAVERDLLIDALPSPSYEPRRWRPSRALATAHLRGGESIDLGDRRLSVLHLPGHSPGSVGLLDEHRGVLFTGDAIYDGTLLDTLPGSDVAAYLTTVRTLGDLDVRVVHAGHNDSFDRARLRSLCETYLSRRG